MGSLEKDWQRHFALKNIGLKLCSMPIDITFEQVEAY
jgi:hypothetical protein